MIAMIIQVAGGAAIVGIRAYQMRQRKSLLIHMLVAEPEEQLITKHEGESSTNVQLVRQRQTHAEENLAMATATLGLGLAGAFIWWPLEFISTPLYWLSMRDLFEYTSRELAYMKEHAIDPTLSLTVTVALLIDPYNLCNVAECVYFAGERLVLSAYIDDREMTPALPAIATQMSTNMVTG